jgi:hypothetical protein
MKTAIAILISIIPIIACSQKYEVNDIDEFYKKVEFESGSLDENGDRIDYIFIETILEQGEI